MVVILLTLVLLFPFLYKYSFVITNQFSQIPIILSFMDVNYLPNDWYVSVSRTFGPRTIFAWYMAQTAKIFTLPVTSFLHYLLYIFLIIYSSYKLAYLIFKNKFIALTTTIAILFGTSITLGGNMLVTADLSAPQLPLAITLLGIVWLIEGKYLSSTLLFTLASYFHPLIGFESTGLFFGAFFFANLLQKKTILLFIKRAILPYFLLTIPAIILYLKEFGNKSINAIDKINILAFMRNPHHYVASTFSFSSFIQFFILLFTFLIFLFLWKRKFFKNEIFRFILIITIVILLSSIGGFIATEVIRFYPLVVLQAFRLTIYLYWLAAIIIIGSSLSLAIKYKSKYSFLFLLPLFTANAQILKPTGKTDFLALLVAVFSIIFFQKVSKKYFIFALILFFSLLRFHYKFSFSSYISFPTEETTIALWAKKNTPTDALFLIPPEFEKFRLIAKRAVIADWKSFPFQEEAMFEWANRMCEIGNIQPCMYKNTSRESVIAGYRTHTQKSLTPLIYKHHFGYIVTNQPLPLKKIYSDRFFIYEAAISPF